MSNSEENPIDPFANINLEGFKTENKNKKVQPDKAEIKAIAEESDFQSRQAIVKKQKIITKTFSLFQDECQIINNVFKVYLDNPDVSMSQPSGSDIVRAALHLFSTKSPEEQVALVKEHRGRGRK